MVSLFICISQGLIEACFCSSLQNIVWIAPWVGVILYYHPLSTPTSNITLEQHMFEISKIAWAWSEFRQIAGIDKLPKTHIPTISVSSRTFLLLSETRPQPQPRELTFTKAQTSSGVCQQHVSVTIALVARTTTDFALGAPFLIL